MLHFGPKLRSKLRAQRCAADGSGYRESESEKGGQEPFNILSSNKRQPSIKGDLDFRTSYQVGIVEI